MATYMLVDYMCKSWLLTINLWVSWIFKFLKILHLWDSSPKKSYDSFFPCTGAGRHDLEVSLTFLEGNISLWCCTLGQIKKLS